MLISSATCSLVATKGFTEAHGNTCAIQLGYPHRKRRFLSQLRYPTLPGTCMLCLAYGVERRFSTPHECYTRAHSVQPVYHRTVMFVDLEIGISNCEFEGMRSKFAIRNPKFQIDIGGNHT